jgi:single-strand DNA-binding protein
MQKLIIAGNVGKDAVLRRTQSGDAVLGFSVAVDNGKDRDGNKRESTWFDCAVFGKRAESLERHITKGLKLTLIGRPTTRAHDGKAYLGISVDDLTFMGGGQSQGNSGGGYDQGGYDQGSGYGAGGRPGGDMDDEIPFAVEVRV